MLKLKMLRIRVKEEVGETVPPIIPLNHPNPANKHYNNTT